jgi:hypothetical protein
VAALGNENICGLEVTMDDALGVCGIERIGISIASERIWSVSIGRLPTQND